MFFVVFCFVLVCRFGTLDADWIRGLMTHSLLSLIRCERKYSGQWKNKMSTSDMCFACLAWLYEVFVGTLISLTNAYAGSGRPTLNVNLNMFCILCLCIILCDTSNCVRKSDFSFERKSHSVECFCCHHYLLSGCHEYQTLCRTNDIRFISKL